MAETPHCRDGPWLGEGWHRYARAWAKGRVWLPRAQGSAAIRGTRRGRTGKILPGLTQPPPTPIPSPVLPLASYSVSSQPQAPPHSSPLHPCSLTGISPFVGENDRTTLMNIRNYNVAFEETTFLSLSREARGFLIKVLVRDRL